ncbi:hypothetical protein PS880_05021 [Pseudomonas fluorescens]|uniref:Uncharacterized protein n=1 Tax=Pseudomonas fluorescens TaxID=294 RepID=A0A5E7P6M8_PSEFL|nr:hypothetical protein PS880_05021 [Pseudomonas fluorescens]
MSWADAAAPVVAKVIRSVGRSDMQVLRKALADALSVGGARKCPVQSLAGRDTSPVRSPAEPAEGRSCEQANRHVHPPIEEPDSPMGLHWKAFIAH